MHDFFGKNVIIYTGRDDYENTTKHLLKSKESCCILNTNECSIQEVHTHGKRKIHYTYYQIT
nr:MAG TPA: hypothetical protein [Caudoviricetes sp.]